MPDSGKPSLFALYSWFVLAYNLLVILWGSVVRATGSGAGCGEHWPLCQGVVIPHGAQIATLIEFAHRASSGVAVVLVIGLVYLGLRSFPSGHPVRRYALAALCFTLMEGLIGAGLVLFGWTGTNTSPARFVVLAIHLANTFMLLAALALTARAAGTAEVLQSAPSARSPSGRYPGPEHQAGSRQVAYGLALLGTLALAITGTVAALADTLFPAASLAQGLSRDFAATSSHLLRVRVIHPILAVIVGIFLLAVAVNAWSAAPSSAARRAAGSLFCLVILQSVLGLLNLLLLAPIAVQVVHLLVADLVWLALVLLAAEALGSRTIVGVQSSEAPPTLKPSAVGTSATPTWSPRR
ncbi:MAG TPA: COX15/CtaA family protein [Terriglobia bacterium]|nr:COX15/CtaA family protein [Terriglobia bacterium]